MATRTTVNVAITPKLDAFLYSRVPSGQYLITSEVVREAPRLLERHELGREDALHRLKAKLERGAGQAARGELLNGDKVFDDFKDLIEERRRAKSQKQ